MNANKSLNEPEVVKCPDCATDNLGDAKFCSHCRITLPPPIFSAPSDSGIVSASILGFVALIGLAIFSIYANQLHKECAEAIYCNSMIKSFGGGALIWMGLSTLGLAIYPVKVIARAIQHRYEWTRNTSVTVFLLLPLLIYLFAACVYTGMFDS